MKSYRLLARSKSSWNYNTSSGWSSDFTVADLVEVREG
jgi:hypothetical protein